MIAHCDDAGGDSKVGEAIQWYAVGGTVSSFAQIQLAAGTATP